MKQEQKYKDPTYKLVIVYILGIVALLVLALSFTGCSTLENKIEKAKVVAYQNPDSFADFCSKIYPVKEKVIKGKDSIVTDTISRTDTVTVIRNINGKIDTVKATCPPCKSITKTLVRIDTVVKESTSLYKEIAIEKYKRLEAEKTAKNRLWWVIGLVSLIGISIFLKIKGKLPI